MEREKREREGRRVKRGRERERGGERGTEGGDCLELAELLCRVSSCLGMASGARKHEPELPPICLACTAQDAPSCWKASSLCLTNSMSTGTLKSSD